MLLIKHYTKRHFTLLTTFITAESALKDYFVDQSTSIKLWTRRMTVSHTAIQQVFNYDAPLILMGDQQISNYNSTLTPSTAN